MGLLKTCPRKYQYTIIDGWSARDESVHLRFGGEYHQALQDYDLSRAANISHEDAVYDVVRELLYRTDDYRPNPDTKAGKYKSREALIRTVIWYLDTIRVNDNYKTHILANGKPAVELSFWFPLEFGPDAGNIWPPKDDDKELLRLATRGLIDSPRSQPYLLCGHLDRVCTDGFDLYVEDHKTTNTTLGPYFFNQFEPNNQMSWYSFGGEVVLETKIKGVVINGVQLLLEPPYNATKRHMTHRTMDQLEEWLFDLSKWLQIAEWYAEANHWPQNDTACDKYGGCQFRGICSKSPQVREIFLKSDFVQLEEKDRWNPLKNR
jgi:hypothetical protein